MSIGTVSIGGGSIGSADNRGIEFDAASNSGYQAAASTYSWNHTCTGADRYLVVGISMLSLAQTVSGITYNSVAMANLGFQNSVSGAARIELWGLLAPSTGTNSIAVTLTGAIASAGNATSFINVHQTSPIEDYNSAQATNVGAADATVTVTTVSDHDWTVDVIATDDTAITAGTGQVERGNVTGVGGSGAMSTKSDKTPAGAQTMSWTNVGALATWAIGSIALRPISDPIIINHDAWADPDDVKYYPRTYLNYLFPSFFDALRIPAFFGKYFADAWATPNQVRYYPRPNYWWTLLPEKYEANPAQIGIFYNGAWSDPDDVMYYPKKNYWFSELPEMYQSEPGSIGIFYTGAWVDMDDVKFYPRKNINQCYTPQPYVPELATVGLIFTAAFTTQLCSPARLPLNLEFLNISPVIVTGFGMAGFDEFIIRARRRGRR